MNNEYDYLKNQAIDYLTIINIEKDLVLCQCRCGNKKYVSIKYLLDKRIFHSCGCIESTKQCPSLYSLWKTFTQEEKSNWGTWNDFIMWSKQQGYIDEVYSNKKIKRKLPYSQDNLEFGIYINKEFFSIQRLKDNRIVCDKELLQFVTSQRIKNLIVSDNKICRYLTKQSSRHKILPDNLFKLLK